MKHLTRKVVSLFTALTVAAGLCTLPQAAAETPKTEQSSVKAVWPGGKLKALTGSFDDGTANYDLEKWLVDTFKANGIKATFALPSGNLPTAAWTSTRLYIPALRWRRTRNTIRFTATFHLRVI